MPPLRQASTRTERRRKGAPRPLRPLVGLRDNASAEWGRLDGVHLMTGHHRPTELRSTSNPWTARHGCATYTQARPAVTTPSHDRHGTGYLADLGRQAGHYHPTTGTDISVIDDSVANSLPGGRRLVSSIFAQLVGIQLYTLCAPCAVLHRHHPTPTSLSPKRLCFAAVFKSFQEESSLVRLCSLHLLPLYWQSPHSQYKYGGHLRSHLLPDSHIDFECNMLGFGFSTHHMLSISTERIPTK